MSGRQVLQELRTGATRLVEVPCPRPGPGTVLVRTGASLVSSGTERMLVDFGRAGLLGKARQQPDKVRQTLEKAGTDGVMATLEAVRSKLDQPLPLGYSNVGRIVALGRGVTGFAVGERVASNGPHAEYVRVPVNLCARVPEAVSDEQAAFTVLGAVALQGLRLAEPSLGETVAVIGLGLIGLLAVQLLRAHGCRVIGSDPDPARRALAQRFGAVTADPAGGQDPVREALAFSRGRGVDAVLIAASAKSSEPVHQAAAMCRKRGRVVLVGVTGLELSRADFYAKELSFQVSCSYGPGRYDPAYEEGGQDYPFGFVRWTAQRNFEAVLDMMADGRLDPGPLVSHRMAFDDAPDAYELLHGAGASLGIVLRYGHDDAVPPPPRYAIGLPGARHAPDATPVCGVIGAGNYASRVLIPALREAGAALATLVTSAGVSAAHHGRRFGFARASTRVEDVLEDPAIDTVVVATRHDTHADLVVRALDAGKHVFVEKPLALSHAEVDAVEEAWRRAAQRPAAPLLTVGFNRRFAPCTVEVKRALGGRTEPKVFIVTVNAGEIPREHWTQDPALGGGRVVGEACHFVDLLRFLCGAPVTQVTSRRLGEGGPGPGVSDNVAIGLAFADGSSGTIHYLNNGGRRFPKERIEVFAGGAALRIENFLRLRNFGWPGAARMRGWRQDKGQKACVRAFFEAIRGGGPAPIPVEELLEVARVSIDAAHDAPR